MGFEIVVRPVVFPDIRPLPARVLAPEDDPKKGVCEINSSSPHPVSLTKTTSINASYSHPVETERRFDEVRIYQQEDNGNINRDNWVQVQVANRIKMRRAKAQQQDNQGVPLAPSGGSADELEKYYYAREKMMANTELINSDQISKNDEAQ